jgi:hypothetical protein
MRAAALTAIAVLGLAACGKPAAQSDNAAEAPTPAAAQAAADASNVTSIPGYAPQSANTAAANTAEAAAP